VCVCVCESNIINIIIMCNEMCIINGNNDIINNVILIIMCININVW